MSDKYSSKLLQFSKLVKDEINIIENGGKLSSFKREVKPREKELREQLKELLKQVAANGQITSNWTETRNFFIMAIK